MTGRPFKKGQSGNPAGRPKGSRARPSILGTQLEALGYDPLAELVRIAKSEEQTDDVRLRVASIVMKYAFLPPTTAEADIRASTYAGRADKLLALVAAGDITLSQAESLLNLLLGAGQTTLMDEFHRRVATLKDKS